MKLPEHKCGLYLSHNECRDYYETVKQYIERGDNNVGDFESDEHRQRCIDTNEIWQLQWYPNTPIGFMKVAAPTLEECLSFANAQCEEVPRESE